MSISQNFPEEGPTLNLNFAGSRTLDPRITFTRTSSATYMGRDGLVKIAPANSARFDHRYNPTTGEVESLGLLVEEARTNLVLQSEDFSTSWTPSNTTVSTNQIAAPDGSTTADKIIETVTITEHGIRQDTVSQVAGTYTASIFAKAGERDVIQFVTTGVLGGQRANFDLTNGILGSVGTQINARITPYSNGWYRCVVTVASTSSGALRAQWNIVTSPTAARIESYLGDGTSGIYIWGAQLEQGAFPTSYIPTTTSTATRTADTAFIGGSDLKTVFNEIEGSIIANISLPNDISVRGDATAGICGLTRYSPQISGFDGYGLTIRKDTRLFSIGHRVIDESKNVNVAISGDITESTILPNQNYKVGFFYSPDLLGLVIGNTSSVSTLSDENYGLYPKTFLYIGRSRNGGSPPYELSGHIAQLTYYPNRLSNSQLVTLTR
jgi:hypothetical protein